MLHLEMRLQDVLGFFGVDETVREVFFLEKMGDFSQESEVLLWALLFGYEYQYDYFHGFLEKGYPKALTVRTEAYDGGFNAINPVVDEDNARLNFYGLTLDDFSEFRDEPARQFPVKREGRRNEFEYSISYRPVLHVHPDIPSQ